MAEDTSVQSAPPEQKPIVPATSEPTNPPPDTPAPTAPATEPVIDLRVEKFGLFNNLYAAATASNDFCIHELAIIPNTSLHSIAQRIEAAMQSVNGTILDGEIAAPALNELDLLVDEFSGKITMAVEVLKTIKPDVDACTSEIITKRNNAMATDPIVAAKTGVASEASIEFLAIPWENISIFGTESILVSHLHEKCGITGDVSMSSVDILSKIIRNGIKLTAVDLPAEKVAELRQVLTTSVPELTRDDVDHLVAFATGKPFVSNWVNRVCNSMINRAQIVSFIGQYLTDIYKYARAIVSVFEKKMVAFSEQSSTGINSNLVHLTKVLQLMAYASAYVRHSVAADTIIIPDDRNKGVLLNKDNYDEFVSKGGTNLLLAQYIRIAYTNQSRIPLHGIGMNNVLERMDEYQKQIAQESLNSEMHVKVTTNYETRRAFQFVMYRYFQNSTKAKELNIQSVSEQLIDIYAAQIVSLNISVEDAVWACIMRVMYQGTFVQVLWETLGAAYVKAIADGGSVSEVDKVVIDARVYADMVLTFLMTNFVVRN